MFHSPFVYKIRQIFCLLLLSAMPLFIFAGCQSRNPRNETDEITMGIDVARYQGTIDWGQVAASGIDFAMVRLGYRTQVSGEIVEDSNARYNMQQASKYGIKLGAYFFSTAINEEEAVEEAHWIAQLISQYPITYPVAYNCEGFLDGENRQFGMSKEERTDVAIAFLKAIEKEGYEGMFYASKNEMKDDAQWITSKIEGRYKIWVAQYPDIPYPMTASSNYPGEHQMWQYSTQGDIPGISLPVDCNIAYFGYESICEPHKNEPPMEVGPDPEALLNFTDVNESVTAKEETNLRSLPSQGDDSLILSTLNNGEIAVRVGICDSGWSKVTVNGKTYYAVSSLLTTDLSYKPGQDDPGIQTQFRSVNEEVTAKEVVNLRNIPSVKSDDSMVCGQLRNGDTAIRIGISENGWSKLEYDNDIYYAVSNYLKLTDNSSSNDDYSEIQTQFEEIHDQVTAKDVVNLRSRPSVEEDESEIISQLKKGEIIDRTGINRDLGWSRVVKDGEVLYCITSYLKEVNE